MADASPLITFGAVIAGGGVSLVTTLAVERFKNRAAVGRDAAQEAAGLATRWDPDLARHASELIATARRLRHVAGRIERSQDRSAALHRLDEAHESLRSVAAQVGLLGSLEVQESARMVVRHAYAVRALAEGLADARVDEYPGASPDDRLVDTLSSLQLAVRRQLRIPAAEDVLDEDVYR